MRTIVTLGLLGVLLVAVLGCGKMSEEEAVHLLASMGSSVTAQYDEDKHVTDMSLSGTLTDLTPLARLTSLKRFRLSHTPVSDLTPLAKLTSLQSLSRIDSYPTT